MDKVASATSLDKPEERFYPGGEEILQRGTMHYGSISSIKDLKYLKMLRPSFCSILIKYTSIKF